MQKVTATLLEKLIRLCRGEMLSASSLKGNLFEELQREQLITSVSHGSRVQYFAPKGDALRTFLESYDDAFKNLEGTLELLKLQDESSRATQVQVSGNSKVRSTRTCKGFLINSYEPIDCVLNGKPFSVVPPEGSYVFIADFENFSVPPNILVVGMENVENFRYIQKQRYLFDSLGKPVLFVCRYPQSGDLVRWLKIIPNEYFHFGDFDLAGIHIYLSEFFEALGMRASFFLPPDVESRIESGSRKRYDDQFQKFSKMQLADPRVKPLVDLIHKHHKGYDQEGFIQFF